MGSQGQKILEGEHYPLEMLGSLRLQTLSGVSLSMLGIAYFPEANQIIDRPNDNQVETFCKSFVTKYRAHGGRIESPNPVIIWGSQNGAEAVKSLVELFIAHKQYPQLMFFILRGPDTELYSRIKKSADCRYGVVSQCVQPAHVVKCNDQYLSNVCMKVNAKLGGTTSQVKVSSGSLIHLTLTQLLINYDSQPSVVANILRSLP